MTAARQRARQVLGALVEMAQTDDLDLTRDRLTHLPLDMVPALIGAAQAHGVEAWLAACAPSAGDAWARLATDRPRFLAVQARTMSAAREIGARLDGSGIRSVLLKGLSIARTAYPRPDLRYSVDLDVLVPPAHFGLIIDTLVTERYRLLDVNWPVIAARVPAQLRLTSPNGTLVDLHWHVLNQPDLRAEFHLPTSCLLARSQPLAGDGLRTLAPADQLIHACVHAALSGGNRLLWLVDLDRIVRSGNLDWDFIVSTAIWSRTGLAVALMLARTRTIFHTPIDDHTLQRLAGGSGWAAGTRLLDSRSRLTIDPTRPAVARVLAASARSGGWQSLAELAKHGLAWLRSGAPRSRPYAAWRDANRDASTLYPVRDDVARAAYFAKVATTDQYILD